MSDERRSLAVIFASVIDAHTARRTGGVVLSRPLARSLLNALNTANREHLEACAEVTRMRRQWLEAVSDKDRLDWLTREGHCLMYYGEKNGVAKWDVPDWGVRGTARGAIDLAMRDDASRVDPVPAVDKAERSEAAFSVLPSCSGNDPRAAPTPEASGEPTALTEAEVRLRELANGPKGGRSDYAAFLSLADAAVLHDELSRLRATVAALTAERGAPKPIKWLLDRADGIRCVYLEEMEQRDGSFLFAVRKLGYVLTKEREWEFEPQPSSRTDEYLARARFATKADAIAAYRASES